MENRYKFKVDFSSIKMPIASTVNNLKFNRNLTENYTNQNGGRKMLSLVKSMVMLLIVSMSRAHLIMHSFESK